MKEHPLGGSYRPWGKEELGTERTEDGLEVLWVLRRMVVPYVRFLEGMYGALLGSLSVFVIFFFSGLFCLFAPHSGAPGPLGQSVNRDGTVLHIASHEVGNDRL